MPDTEGHVFEVVDMGMLDSVQGSENFESFAGETSATPNAVFNDEVLADGGLIRW